jgi:hypothetical protein
MSSISVSVKSISQQSFRMTEAARELEPPAWPDAGEASEGQLPQQVPWRAPVGHRRRHRCARRPRTTPPTARGKALTFPFLGCLSFLLFFLNISCYPSSLGGQIIGWFSFGSISSMCIFFNQQFDSFPWKRRQGIEVTGASAAMNAQQSFFYL